jgi:hypothetical protein
VCFLARFVATGTAREDLSSGFAGMTDNPSCAAQLAGKAQKKTRRTVM